MNFFSRRICFGFPFAERQGHECRSPSGLDYGDFLADESRRSQSYSAHDWRERPAAYSVIPALADDQHGKRQRLADDPRERHAGGLFRWLMPCSEQWPAVISVVHRTLVWVAEWNDGSLGGRRTLCDRELGATTARDQSRRGDCSCKRSLKRAT